MQKKRKTFAGCPWPGEARASRSAEPPCSTFDIVDTLRVQAQEIADENHAGWGNTMTTAADEIERLRKRPNAGAVPRRGSDVGTSPLLGIDRLRREMLAAGIPSEHAAVATGLAAEYASTAYTQGHGRGFNQGVEWQKSRVPNNSITGGR
jgi:hypothetical protein